MRSGGGNGQRWRARWRSGGQRPSASRSVQLAESVGGDWAHGVIMPVRMESPRTREEEMKNGGGLARLFNAVTLPVPETAEGVSETAPNAAVEVVSAGV